MKKKNLFGLLLFMVMSLFSSQVWAADPAYEATNLNTSEFPLVLENGTTLLGNSASSTTIAVEYSIDAANLTGPSVLVGGYSSANASSGYWAAVGVSSDGLFFKAPAKSRDYTASCTATGNNVRVVFVNSTAGCDVYLNGVSLGNLYDTNLTFQSGMYNIGNGMAIGALPADASNAPVAFPGTIHSVRIYTSALTADEVAALEWPEVAGGGNEGGDTAPEYCVPDQTTTYVAAAYLTAITSTGAKDGELNYTASTRPTTDALYLLTEGITVEQGGKFSLNFVANSPSSGDRLYYTHAEIFADWNGDGEFTGSFDVPTADAQERVTKAGEGEWIQIVGYHRQGCADVENITQEFTVPADAKIGATRIRVKYTDAWHVANNGSTQHGPCETIHKGIVYDIPVTIVEGTSAPTTYTVNVVTPENGTIVLKNGTEEVASGTALAENTTIVVEATAADGYELEGIYAGETENIAEAEELTASDEGVYSFPLVANAYVFATFTEKAPAKEYIYRATDLTFEITSPQTAPAYVPEAETAEILAAENLTIAIDYTLPAENVIGSGNTYALALTSATDLNAGSAWATAAIMSWGTNNNGMTIRYNENGGQYGQSGTLTGEHVKVVYVLTANGFEYYINGARVKDNSTVDLRFKTLVPNANSVQIGGCETAWDYKYPFNGTIHSITYYNKGDKNLTEEQFNALFPAEEPEAETYAITVNNPEEYTIIYCDATNNIGGSNIDDITAIAKTVTKVQIDFSISTSDLENKEVKVTYNDVAAEQYSAQEVGTKMYYTYTFETNGEDGTLSVTLEDKTVAGDFNVITVDIPEEITSDNYGFFYYDYANQAFVDVDPSAINNDIVIVYFALVVPSNKIPTVTFNDEVIEPYGEYDNEDGTVQYSYYFYNENGSLKVNLEDKVCAVTVVNNENVELGFFYKEAMVTIDELQALPAGSLVQVFVGEIPEGKELKSVTWKEEGSSAQTLETDDLGAYAFTVNNNGTLTIKVTEIGALEYCTYEGNHNNNNGRTFNSLSLNDFTFAEEIGYRDLVYNDRSENVWEAEAGQEVTVNVNWSGSWMHGYLYIDYDQDGEFDCSLNADGTPAAGSEVVAYTFYSADGGSTGYNSLGETTGNNPGFGSFPGFKLPEDLDGGDYRVRFKLDWNEIDPCGIHADGQNSLTANGGLILDLTMRIPSTDVPAYAVLVPETDGTYHYQFRFDDIVLGEHENGTNNKLDGTVTSDQRARNFTMSTWVKAQNLNGQVMGQGQKIFYGAEGTFGVHIVDGQLKLVSRSWTDEGSCPGDISVMTDATLAVDEWAFVTVVVDDTNRTLSLYKNGILVTSQAIGGNGIGLLADEGVFFVGNSDFSCYVDEVQVWTKALTEDEVRAAMHGFAEIPAELAAYYKVTSDAQAELNNLGSYQETAVPAGVYKGTSTYNAAYWGYVYEGEFIETTIVDGHQFQKYTVNVTTTGEGTVAIMNGETEVKNGKKVVEGTILNVVATPAEGYVLESITVNGEVLEGTEFAVNADMNIEVVFASTTFSVTVNLDDQTEEYMSYIEIQDQDGNSYNNGEKLPAEAEARLVFYIAEGDYVASLKVTGSDEELKDQIVDGVYVIGTLTENMEFDVVLATGDDAVNGVNADSKAIYYADGVVYNYAGEIAIYDVNGQLIVRTSETTVDVRDLVNGVYIVRSADKVVRFVK